MTMSNPGSFHIEIDAAKGADIAVLLNVKGTCVKKLMPELIVEGVAVAEDSTRNWTCELKPKERHLWIHWKAKMIKKEY